MRSARVECASPCVVEAAFLMLVAYDIDYAAHQRGTTYALLSVNINSSLLLIISLSQFTAPDLAQIAQDVDRQERESLDVESYEDASANMDDTGMIILLLEIPCRGCNVL